MQALPIFLNNEHPYQMPSYVHFRWDFCRLPASGLSFGVGLTFLSGCDPIFRADVCISLECKRRPWDAIVNMCKTIIPTTVLVCDEIIDGFATNAGLPISKWVYALFRFSNLSVGESCNRSLQGCVPHRLYGTKDIIR